MQYGILHIIVAVFGLRFLYDMDERTEPPGWSKTDIPSVIRKISAGLRTKRPLNQESDDTIIKSFNNVATPSSQQAFGAIEMAKERDFLSIDGLTNY